MMMKCRNLGHGSPQLVGVGPQRNSPHTADRPSQFRLTGSLLRCCAASTASLAGGPKQVSDGIREAGLNGRVPCPSAGTQFSRRRNSVRTASPS